VWTEPRFENYDIFMFTITPVASCGDGSCNGAETCATCPDDCQACPPVCGDGSCNGTEVCDICVADCGECEPPPPRCGDGICQDVEGCGSCPADCGECPPADVCDDGGTLLAEVELERDHHGMVEGLVLFTADPWRDHWICLVNGNPDGTARASHAIVWVSTDGVVINPSDLKPHGDPPAKVVVPFDAWFVNYSVVRLFGPHPPERIKVEYREAL
jgi:hypothetical protein